MHSNYIQLPPDSTGKKLLVNRVILITVVDSSLLLRDMDIITSVSLNELRVNAVVVLGSTHMIHAMFTTVAQETITPIQVGEHLTHNGDIVGTVTSPEPYYEFFNATSLVSADNPYYGQKVDYRGAASVRFSEGSPLSDAFGNLKTSNRSTIGVYDYVADSYDSLYSDVIVGGGSIDYIAQYSTMSLSVGSASGDFASRITNKYHYYSPGTSNLTLMTIALSDDGMNGVERRWGIFDANDGAYFALDDLGVLNITVRNSTSGTVVKTHYPRAEWNGDKLDGSGGSGFNLDLTHLNIYWIDYQWLGAGRIRAGVVDEFGNRIVCHTVLNANSHLYPYMKSGSLPIQVNIQNKTATGGSASIRVTCCSVQAEGALDYTYWRYVHDFPSTSVPGNNVYCLAMKSVNTVASGHNRTNAYPESLSCYVASGTVKVDIYWDYLTASGQTWALTNDSTLLGDIAGSVTLDGTEYRATTFYLDTGSHNLDLRPFFDKSDMGIDANADELTPQYFVIVASKVAGTPTFQGSVGYAEVG